MFCTSKLLHATKTGKLFAEYVSSVLFNFYAENLGDDLHDLNRRKSIRKRYEGRRGLRRTCI